MTELVIIGAIGALASAFAATVARWLVRQPSGDRQMMRTAALVAGGAERYLKRQNTVAIALASVIGAAIFLVYGIAYQTGLVTATAPREFGLWVTASFMVGACLAIVVGWIGAWASRQAIARVATGACRSLDESLQIAIRAGAVSGVAALALALLGLALLFSVALWYAPDTASGVARAAWLVPGYALGAACVAFLAQVGGGIFAKVADVGADVAGKLEAALPEDAPNNPAAVADLVGDNVGDGAARATGLYAATAAESLAAMLIAGLLFGANDLPSATAVVLFPLVVRTFGLLSAWFGVMVVRTDDREVPMNALSRGLYVTTVLSAVAIAGCAKWLLGPYWLHFAGCGVLGAAASLAFLYVIQYYTEQKYRPVRSLAEAARGGATLATLRGLFTAAERAIALIAIVALTTIVSYYLGAASSLTHGGLFGVAIATGGMLASSPYVLAMDAMGSMVDTAGGVIELTTVATERPDVRARARLLDAVGTTVKSFTKSLTVVSTSVGCFLLLAAFRSEVIGGTEITSTPTLYIGAFLGLLVMLSFIWAMLSRIVQASRDLMQELRGWLASGAAQLVGSPLAPSALARHDTSADREPAEGDAAEQAQLACVEIVSRVALRSMLLPAAVGVGLPLFIGVALRAVAPEGRVAASAEALVALLFVATVSGALGSLLFTGAGSAWDNAKKYIETGAHGGRFIENSASTSAEEINNPTYEAAVIGDTIGDPLKGAVGPAIQALVITLATLTLVFTPFFK